MSGIGQIQFTPKHHGRNSEMSDEELAAAVRGQRPAAEDAVTTLLKRYETDVYQACLAYLRDRSAAEEASQEVLIRIYRGLDGFQGRSSFRTWLYRIIQNQCSSIANYYARHRVCESLDETLHQEFIVMNDGDLTAVSSATYIEIASVAAALQRLSRNDREVIHLRFFYDFSLNAIAERLNVSLSGAKMRLYRALARFETALQT